MSDDLYRREFIGQPRPPEPSPGPWRVKGPIKPSRPFHLRFDDDRDLEWVVLDANDKCVATCDRQIDALYIAENGPRGHTPTKETP